MASLFKAVRNLFREKKDAAAKSLSDPVRDAKYDIEDSKKQIADFEQKVAQLMATNNQSKRKQSASKEEVKKWGALAKKAAEAGSEKDVTTAITKKQFASNEVVVFTKEIKINEKIVANLRNQLTQARNKIAKAESNSAQLSARLEGAKIRKELTNASTEFGGGPLAGLDNLEKAVDTAESEADAYEDLREDTGGDLEEKYGSGDVDIDDEVAKLMASVK